MLEYINTLFLWVGALVSLAGTLCALVVCLGVILDFAVTKSRWSWELMAAIFERRALKAYMSGDPERVAHYRSCAEQAIVAKKRKASTHE
jgi:hypothetical protein